MDGMEERLVAYVDGELDRRQVAEIEDAIAHDPRARQLVVVYRETAAWLRTACAGSCYQPPVLAPRCSVVAEKPRRGHRWWAAMAASIVLLALPFATGYLVGKRPVLAVLKTRPVQR